MKHRKYTLTQKVLSLFIALLLCSFLQIQAKTFVNCGPQTRNIPLLKDIGNTLDEVRCPIGDIVLTTTNTTIIYSGLYILGQDIPDGIHITVSDVTIDLNGYTIIDSSGTSHGITIDENLKNIFIKNGNVQGSGKATSTTHGIWIKERCDLITMQEVNIYDCYNGLYLDGLSTYSCINSCNFKNCTFYDNNKGVVMNYTKKSSFENCEALNCVEAGFELFHCKYNTFFECLAQETKSTAATEQAIGFSCESGLANLFIKCVANGTEKTTCNFGYNAIGFLLKGSATASGEYRTELINCIASKSTAAGDGVAYGAQLDATLISSPLAVDKFIAGAAGPANANTVDWSPNSDFIAIGYNYVAESNPVRIYSLDGITLKPFAQKNPNSKSILSVAWSPRGNYLAVGTANNPDAEDFFVYKFNPDDVSVDFFTLLDKKLMGTGVNASVSSVAWTEDTRYVGIGVGTGALYELRIWGFQNERLGNSEIAKDTSTENILGIAFSPDNKYIASITANRLKIYRFNTLSSTPLTVKVNTLISGGILYGGSLKTIHWSPIACGSKYFLAIGGAASGLKNIQILEYNGDTTLTSFETKASLSTTSDINSVKWSPNGKYLLTGGNSSGGNDAEIFTFNASASSGSRLSSQGTGNLSGGAVNSVGWSPGGKYTMLAGNGTDPVENLAIFKSANIPSKCVIKYCELLNCSGGLCGIGLEGPSCRNLIVRNIGYENGINFNYAAFNTFKGGLNGDPSNIDNVSFPPYED